MGTHVYLSMERSIYGEDHIFYCDEVLEIKRVKNNTKFIIVKDSAKEMLYEVNKDDIFTA